MNNPLDENPGHLQTICSRLNLGTPIKPLQRVLGGFHHLMWRLDTGQGGYAIKQLAADIDVTNAEVVQHFNVTEAIAELFTHHGVCSIHALRVGDDYLQVCDRSGYLVYPWSNARKRPRDEISEGHAMKVARVLATMHRANIQVAGARDPEFAALTREEITELVGKAEQYCIHKARALHEQLENFFAIAEAQKAAIEVLNSHRVISHGDLDQKNVLWDADDNPVLIDWESARHLNPTYEIVVAGLDWGGITSKFDRNLFAKIILAYQQAGGVIEQETVQAAFHCILGDWLTWMLYTVARAVEETDPQQRNADSEPVDWILPTILRLQQAIPELLSLGVLWQRISPND